MEKNAFRYFFICFMLALYLQCSTKQAALTPRHVLGADVGQQLCKLDKIFLRNQFGMVAFLYKGIWLGNHDKCSSTK